MLKAVSVSSIAVSISFRFVRNGKENSSFLPAGERMFSEFRI
jgi:hypothetical protein